jgi:hypothetical protein
MADATFDNGALRVSYPDMFGAPRDLTRDDSPRPGGEDRADLDEPAALIVNALDSQEFTSIRPLALTSPTATRGLGAPAGPATWVIDVDVDADESAVLLVDHDGVLSWQAPQRDDRLYRSNRAVGSQSPACATFELAVGGSPSAREAQPRSFSLLGAIGGVRVYVLKFAAGLIAGKAIESLERNVQPGLVRMASSDPKQWQRVSDLTGIPLPQHRVARILLFLHGTFSSTLGSFAGLAATERGEEFLDNAIRSYDAVLGFDHPTLSLDPMENAIDLLRRLSAAALPRPPTIDIVGYSRGGLVARSLVEGLLPSAEWRATAGRVVFVGVPNGGTSMANPDHWERFLNLYTNLAVASLRVIGLITGSLPIAEIAAELLKGVGPFAKYLATYRVDGGGVPGLAAMNPRGEFVRELNKTQPGQPGPGAPWYVISSAFEPGKVGGNLGAIPAELKRRLLDSLAHEFSAVPNDLVVDTESMSAIDPDVAGLVAGSLLLSPNGEVYHLTYFVQPPVANALQTWLIDAMHNVPAGSVVTVVHPSRTERKIVVLDTDDIVRDVRKKLQAGPPMVVIRNTGGVFDRDVGGLSPTTTGDLSADVEVGSGSGLAGGITFYPMDLATAAHAVNEAADDLTVADALNISDLTAAPAFDVSDLTPDLIGIFDRSLPRGAILTRGRTPVGVVTESMVAAALDKVLSRHGRAHAELTADPAEPDGPTPPRLELRAQMADRVQHLAKVAVACTLSREGTVVEAEGKKGVFTPPDPDNPVVIRLITVSNAQVVGKSERSFPPPGTGEVNHFFFEFVPTQLGSCTVWVVATQGEEQLLTLVLTAVVVAEVTGLVLSPPIEARVPTDPRPELVGAQQLVIWEKIDGAKVSFEYDMVNHELGIKVHGSSPVDLGERKDFVAGIYTVLESTKIAADEDSDDFMADLQDLGSDLFSRVFPIDLQRALWQNKDRLTRLVVRSSEPFIPWELIHLKDPDGDGTRPDELMFLGQLGLVRWLNPESASLPPTTLRYKRFRILCARYQDPRTQTLAAIDDEENFLDQTFKAEKVEPTKTAMRTFLKSGEFDIFHFAGHGLARQAGLKDTVIELGDTPLGDDRYRAIFVNDKAVRENAVLDKAHTGGPLVFLNACQAGRLTMQLGSMGGFAQAFLSRGAGAFISTLWSVGDQLARTFGEEFYLAMLDGEEVSAAVRRARAKGRQSRNISWLAYVVYANPVATFESV